MTTHGRESRVSRLAASLGDAGRPAASEPAPEELPPAPPVAGPDRRIRIAWHEAGHATALIHLLGPDAVVAASIRRGRSFHGVTLLGAPPTDRRGSELRIVATLCGDLAAQLPPPGTGYDETSDDATADEAAAVAAAASLERLVPLARERLLEAEAEEPSPDLGDEARAESAASALAESLAAWGDRNEVDAHLWYLRCVASAFVGRHVHAIRKVAEALLAETTLDGATVAQLVQGTLCTCHGYAPHPKGVSRCACLGSHPSRRRRSAATAPHRALAAADARPSARRRGEARLLGQVRAPSGWPHHAGHDPRA